MKKLLLTATLFYTCAAFAQKDKTANWPVTKTKEGRIEVTSHSKPAGKNYFERLGIAPNTDGLFNISVTPTQQSIVEIRNGNKVLFNELLTGNKVYAINVNKTDSVIAFFTANPEPGKTVYFNYVYTEGKIFLPDTAKVILGTDAKTVFEQLLPLARNKFANLFYNDEKDKYQDIEYPKGLFAPARAVKDRYWVKQYTGMAQTKEVAVKNAATWNRKIKEWLKEYNITEVKTRTDQYNDDTIYIKLNKDGVPLFAVTVFCNEDSGGFYTGVMISHKP